MFNKDWRRRIRELEDGLDKAREENRRLSYRLEAVERVPVLSATDRNMMGHAMPRRHHLHEVLLAILAELGLQSIQGTPTRVGRPIETKGNRK